MNRTIRTTILLTTAILLSIGILALKEDDERFKISKALNIFASLFRDVNTFYVDNADPEKMVQTGIDAMLRSLDPYTEYYPESRLEEFKLMTTGEYAGIGAIVGMRPDKNNVIIREPYINTPSHKAGLLPGDEILEIDGQDMTGKDVAYVSARPKGKPGEQLTLKIARPGIDKPLHFTLRREVVQLPCVPYHGMISPEVGYISFSSFLDKSASDVKNAILDLRGQGMQSLILDLRGNGGGLLDQAVEIANYFLPKGSLIVSTKGKMTQWDKEYVATKNPILPDAKVIILIDRAVAYKPLIIPTATPTAVSVPSQTPSLPPSKQPPAAPSTTAVVSLPTSPLSRIPWLKSRNNSSLMIFSSTSSFITLPPIPPYLLPPHSPSPIPSTTPSNPSSERKTSNMKLLPNS